MAQSNGQNGHRLNYGTRFQPLSSLGKNTEQSQWKKKKAAKLPPTPLARTKPSMSLALNFSTEDIFNTKKPGGDWTKPHLPSEVFWTMSLDPELRESVLSLSRYRGASHPKEKDEGMNMERLKKEKQCFRCGHTGHQQKDCKCDHEGSGSPKTLNRGGPTSHGANKWDSRKDNAFAVDSPDMLDRTQMSVRQIQVMLCLKK
ncbi:uncharacterized protein EV420DRAFT_1648798 [Desarmillaria tabescens]|uniref:CCHC-type domain-containing protein n=1 Tax=Armillaria tabescens TaxID=1929756 RepID=A0AA39JKY0_ARMTA|nr:uncharacterized protein EV420DRAFT_1648798 [Desarmillaria tabescens]KAK0444518.1 hypothetical protein EV420DRAFT_1648798 [Desarmillaria tabescens]